MTPADVLAGLFGLEAEPATVYDDTAHHLAWFAAGIAVRQSVPDAAIGIRAALSFASGAADPSADPGDVLAVAVIQRLAQIIRTLAAGSENPLATNLRTHEQLTDVQAAQLPAEVERFLTQLNARGGVS